jgi:hypothetical protein
MLSWSRWGTSRLRIISAWDYENGRPGWHIVLHAIEVGMCAVERHRNGARSRIALGVRPFCQRATG